MANLWVKNYMALLPHNFHPSGCIKSTHFLYIVSVSYTHLDVYKRQLSAREKCLIAFAVAHAVQCPYCIGSYAQSCLQQGYSQEQMIEAIHAAAAIRGGATLAHGLQAKNVLKKLQF